jgi:ArsR family transcriptional regulator
MSPTISIAPDLFRAFADVTRLRLLNLLLEGELCVCDLCDVLDEIQPKVSRHLAYLRRAGLLRVRTRGKWKYYAVARHPKDLERKLLNCVKSCLREVDVLQDDLRRLREISPGACCRSEGDRA